MQSTTDNNLTVIYSGTHADIVDTVQAIAGSAPCHVTNGIYGRQNLPIRQTLLAGFRYMMDREMPDTANPPVLVVAVNSDKSIADFNMMQNAPTYADRVAYLAGALKLLEPTSNVIFLPYDEETPAEIYAALNEAGVNLRSIHKHGGYGQGKGFPTIPGMENFDISACFPLLSEQQALYEQQTERATTAAQIVADLYSDKNAMGFAYLSADAKSPRILFPAPVALLTHMGQFVIPASAPHTPEPK